MCPNETASHQLALTLLLLSLAEKNDYISRDAACIARVGEYLHCVLEVLFSFYHGNAVGNGLKHWGDAS